MLAEPPKKTDFDFSSKIVVDNQNEGFTPTELEKILDDIPVEPGGRGGIDWINNLWKPNRSSPPEIKNLKSQFGYQSKLHLIDLVKLAKAQGTPLEGQVQVLSENFNFFVMPCGVFISPEDGEKFEALKFEVHFKHPAVSTYSMFPEPDAKKIFEIGGKINTGITGKAEFKIPEIPHNPGKLEGDVNAEVETKFIFSFNYEYKTQIIDGFGRNTSFCKWVMHKGTDLRNDVNFYPVVKTPKSVNEFDCEFVAFFKIGHHNWKQSEFFKKPKELIKVTSS